MPTSAAKSQLPRNERNKTSLALHDKSFNCFSFSQRYLLLSRIYLQLYRFIISQNENIRKNREKCEFLFFSSIGWGIGIRIMNADAEKRQYDWTGREFKRK